jgi:sulfur-carrier protein adenylyltransferase/sulfurtransferase
MHYLTPAELKAKLDNSEKIQIIDTRDKTKFDECHISGAINIQSIDIPDSLHLIEKDFPVIIYCHYGVKSDAPYLFLREKQKMKNIFILEGGLFQWASEIQPEMPIL